MYKKYPYRVYFYLCILHHEWVYSCSSYYYSISKMGPAYEWVTTKFTRISSEVSWIIGTDKVKWFRYRPGVAQRVGRGIPLLFHGRWTRRGWVVNSTPRLHFTPGKDTVPILQKAGWAPGPVWTDRKSRSHRDSIPDRSIRCQSLYRLSYPAHNFIYLFQVNRALKCTVCGGFRVWFPVSFRDWVKRFSWLSSGFWMIN